MKFKKMRDELRFYYDNTSYENAEHFLKTIPERLDSEYNSKMTSFEMKTLQYRTIADMFEPVIFENSPF